MTYNVLMGTLNPTHSLTHYARQWWWRCAYCSVAADDDNDNDDNDDDADDHDDGGGGGGDSDGDGGGGDCGRKLWRQAAAAVHDVRPRSQRITQQRRSFANDSVRSLAAHYIKLSTSTFGFCLNRSDFSGDHFGFGRVPKCLHGWAFWGLLKQDSTCATNSVKALDG